MSFFKKLTEDFKGLKASLSDKEHESTTHGHGYQETHEAYPQHSYEPPQANPGTSALAPGWLAQFDPNSQRWFYIEQATGRTQWESPNASAGQYAHGDAHHEHSRGDLYDQHGGAHYPYSSHDHHDPHHEHYSHGSHGDHHYDHHGSEHEKSDKGKMLLAGAGGVAVGGLAVAAFSGDSDDNEHAAPPPDPYAASPPDAAPPPPVDESDHESLQEAQEEYNEAAAEAADSDASSSEQEELQEAQEEYEEEAEEAYGD